MNDVRYKWILYSIVIVILTTIGIQVYWNYKNYLNSKKQLINDVQISLDKAVDDYYANLAENTTLGFAFESSDSAHIFGEKVKLDSIIENNKISGHNLDSLNAKHIKSISLLRSPQTDSILEFNFRTNHSKTNKPEFDVFTDLKPDSLNKIKFRL